MKIYSKDDSVLLEVIPFDESYRERRIMGEDSITLIFSLFQHEEIPVGSYIVFQGETYVLYRPVNILKHHSRNFEYTAIFEAPKAALSIYKLKDIASSRLKFTLTVRPHEFIDLIIANLNQRDFGWTRGECIDEAERPLSFNHVYLNEALQMVAEEFNTEYEIVGKEISLRKVEYNKENPLPLSYGRGNGFRTGVKRENFDLSKSIDVLYVEGGDRNIDFSKYGSKELLLPKNQTFEYEGNIYVSDDLGFSIRRVGNNNYPLVEDSLDCTHVYPKREGVVTQLIEVNAGKHEYDIIDSTIPNNLDYSECRIAGEKATIIFQSGMLSGKEFDLVQTSKALTGYKHGERRFQIVPQEYDGIMMPNDIFKPKASTETEEGDRYAIFNIHMPDAYISDNESQEGASWEMFREAVKYLYENEMPRFSFIGELDPIYAKKNWLSIGGKIRLGGYVEFTDEQFQEEPALIRIMGIRDYINFPYRPELELSNITASGSFLSTLNKLEADEVVIEQKKEEALQYTKRSYRDTQETASMLQAAFDKLSDDFGKFTGSVSPLTIDTMQLIVGDESLQFRFVNSVTTPNPVSHKAEWEPETSRFVAKAGILQHMTLGIKKIQPEAKTPNSNFWIMRSYVKYSLYPEKAYYLYAQCSKSSTTGNFILSEYAFTMEGKSSVSEMFDDLSNYYFLYGILNSEFEGSRSFVRMYGFTEILPGRITTDIIASSDGNTYFDLQNNIIKGNISFRLAGGGYKDVETAIDDTSNYINTKIDSIIGNPNLVQNSIINESSNEYGFGHREVYVKEGVVYTLSANGRCNDVTFGKYLRVYIHNPNWDYSHNVRIETTENSTSSISFTAQETGLLHISSYYYDDTSEREGTVTVNWYKLEVGAKATAWRPAELDTSLLYKALEGSTDVLGGLVATNVLLLKDELKSVKAGMSGLEDDNVGVWLGGNYVEAKNKTSKILLNKDGSGHFLSGAFKFTADNKLIIELDNFKINEDGNVKIIGGFETGGDGEKVVIDENAKRIYLLDSRGEPNVTIFNESAPNLSFGRLNIIASNASETLHKYVSIIGTGAVSIGDSVLKTQTLLTDNLITMYSNQENGEYFFSVNRMAGRTHLQLKDIPTSSAGLEPGTIYRSGKDLRIVT